MGGQMVKGTAIPLYRVYKNSVALAIVVWKTTPYQISLIMLCFN